jgi:hypothetical protein
MKYFAHRPHPAKVQNSLEDSIRRMMASMMLAVVQEYLGTSPQATLEGQADAEAWIFNDSDDSSNYVFGFKSVCAILDLCPHRTRRAIRERKKEADIR